MIRVRLRYGDCRVEVETDADPYPDLLDEMVARALRLFLDSQAALPEEPDDATEV